MISAQLYVKGQKTTSQSITADSTLIRADSINYTADATGGITITEEYQRVTMFNDENISITSSIQNLTDISKTYTDFSQSFTIPADDINNALFLHWYNNFIDDGFDARLRVDAIMYVDTKVFRYGLIQLDKANIVDAKAQSYTLTFFGKLVSLKDKIKENKLNSLNRINELYAYNYSSTDVIDRVKDAVNNDIQFPLISSKRNWSWNDGYSTDIKTSAGAIFYNELFPALRVKAIFDAIAYDYGITFQSTFFQTKKFTDLFLHLKSRQDFYFISKEQLIAFMNIVGTSEYFSPNMDGSVYYNGRPFGDEAFLNISILQTTGPFTIRVYKDDNLFVTFNGTGATYSQGFQIFNDTLPGQGNSSYIGTYTFTISTTQTYAISVLGYSYNNSSGIGSQFVADATTPSTGLIDLLAYMPDMKIADFISGILKMFNLTIYSYDENIYHIETLEDFYASGDKVDLTEFVEDSNDLERVKSYSKIVFKYAKSESYMNAFFFQNNNLEWGELQSKFDYDGGEFNIAIPFENILHNHFNGSSIQVSYYVKTDFITSIVPKAPVLLYRYGNITNDVDFYMKDASGTATHCTSYNAFGQDSLVAGINYSLNFGYENSSLLQDAIENGLYHEYYMNYLLNIYNPKGRIVKIKARLTPSIILNLKLNDRIIISQKPYIINSFTTDLMTGIVNFDLISDFRKAS
jgi:hypothetical protein